MGRRGDRAISCTTPILTMRPPDHFPGGILVQNSSDLFHFRVGRRDALSRGRERERVRVRRPEYRPHPCPLPFRLRLTGEGMALPCAEMEDISDVLH